ncbi:biosynthetic peptidoglycan transglycosylase [Extibacter muris]|uniref:biosynthetic peptidoglycan transglycosylase n=1 Tax=Extibacter muris TaxID=1796622 RepID=UPI001D08FFE1|nr:biosynthetic peptidoglycan transglycosylase [Extibacter muris]MCB6201639.1 transglycosylase domain-containing protein [Extibacter muris]MCQ4662965.1 transglycosylase domain-containing protein [Extibacter muris]MCQ4693231.1 transglycosylase domain-containing protein [Extibacter muris]
MKRKRKTRHRIRKAAFGLLLVLLCIMMGTGIFYAGKGYGLYRKAITAKSVDERIRDVRGAEDYTTYMELPQFYIKAAICTEDRRFKDHCGIDLFAIARAAWADLKALSFVEGGSTITQQLVKNLLFTNEKKLERKAAEVFAALEVESKYSKEEIFELYANSVYFGGGYYGIYEASMGYFGKEPSELTDYESAMLAGVPNAPSLYSPDTDKEAARRRAGQVLDSMVRQKIITKAEAERIRSSGLIRKFSSISAAPTKLRPVHTPSE